MLQNSEVGLPLSSTGQAGHHWHRLQKLIAVQHEVGWHEALSGSVRHDVYPLIQHLQIAWRSARPLDLCSSMAFCRLGICNQTTLLLS